MLTPASAQNASKQRKSLAISTNYLHDLKQDSVNLLSIKYELQHFNEIFLTIKSNTLKIIKIYVNKKHNLCVTCCQKHYSIYFF